MTFAESLLIARRRTGLSQSEAARLMDVSGRTLFSWESGDIVPHAFMQKGALALLAALPDKQTKKWEESVVVKPVPHPIQQFAKDVEENAPPSPVKGMLDGIFNKTIKKTKPNRP